MAYATKFVKAMPRGLDTEVGERGIKVSGGQRQRLAIARAFLRDPKILMLDEATASLDSESEMMVQQALDKLMVNRTTLVIAHRLSTITDADEIYFIENGRVSGHGTHKQLVKSTPLYREYVENQFSEEKTHQPIRTEKQATSWECAGWKREAELKVSTFGSAFFWWFHIILPKHVPQTSSVRLMLRSYAV